MPIDTARRSETAVYAISRLRRAKRAWVWRVHFRRRGKLYAKSFPDLKHGGKREALAAAIAWRDARLDSVEPLTLREFNELRRSNNTSGVAGVHSVGNLEATGKQG